MTRRPGRPARAGRLAVAAGLAVAAAVAGCVAIEGTSTLSTVGEPEGPAVQIVADNLAFDRATLVVTAGQPFTLVLDNRDGAPHNVAIYRDATASDRLFGGDIFNGPASRQYPVPALPAGTWYFRCDVHPAMHGEVVAAPAAPATLASP